jgi:molybdopterin-synthase adenylyltransferase
VTSLAQETQPAGQICGESAEIERYSRQVLFRGIGEEGQRKLAAARVAIVGCGATGSALAGLLARAGVGTLRIIDRDYVEPSNLQRQSLFDEKDAAESLPKAIAAARKISHFNSQIAVEPKVDDLVPANIQDLLEGIQLILDGTDNFETRFLVNELAVKTQTPWIYAAAVASYGLTFTILPGQTACLACLAEYSSAGLEETCDTIGVLGPIVNLISSLQVAEAIKLLSGRQSELHLRLLSCDVWSGRMQSIRPERNPQCTVCVRQEFAHLAGQAQPHITMCGRDSVQIHERRRVLDLSALQQRLQATLPDVRQNGFLLRFQVPPYEMTVFSDGRAILKGTKDPAIARSLYAKYIGA